MADYIASESIIKIPDSAQRVWFDVFMNGYITQLKGAKEHNIIHILPRIKNPNYYPLAPTLAPTSLNFQSLPFIAEPGDKEGKEGVEAGKANMLIYLQMTGDQGEQRMPPDLLPLSVCTIFCP